MESNSLGRGVCCASNNRRSLESERRLNGTTKNHYWAVGPNLHIVLNVLDNGAISKRRGLVAWLTSCETHHSFINFSTRNRSLTKSSSFFHPSKQRTPLDSVARQTPQRKLQRELSVNLPMVHVSWPFLRPDDHRKRSSVRKAKIGLPLAALDSSSHEKTAESGVIWADKG